MNYPLVDKRDVMAGYYWYRETPLAVWETIEVYPDRTVSFLDNDIGGDLDDAEGSIYHVPGELRGPIPLPGAEEPPE